MEIKEPAPKYSAKMSAQEYLDWERKQEYKNEYYSGDLVAMSGASLAHNFIHANVFGKIYAHLEGKSCYIFSSELRIEVKEKESYFYPDVTIVCAEPILVDDKMDMITNPTVIIEILTPSTEKYEEQRKKVFYMQMPSLKEYVMIDSTGILVDVIRRTEGNKWENKIIISKDDSLYIAAIDLNLPLTQIYKNVKL